MVRRVPLTLLAMVATCAALVAFAPSAPAQQRSTRVPVGVARASITPDFPVRLQGFPRGERAKPTAEVAQPIHVKAMAIGDDASGPVVLIVADIAAVPGKLADAVAAELARNTAVRDRAHVTVCATHAHSAPALGGVIPYIFDKPASAVEQAQIDRFTELVRVRMIEAARAALADRKPARVSWARGSVDFAINRRELRDGKWVRFGHNPDGPVDHDMPMLAVRSPEGKLRAVVANYACHGVCWHSPSVHGDWMGSAQLMIEKDHPGSIAMVTIGCAGDQNPPVMKDAAADDYGRMLADEVKRLLRGTAKPLTSAPEAKLKRIDLPLGPPPPVKELRKSKDRYARIAAAEIEAGRELASTLPYVVQTWAFGDDLAIAFLAGEVCVDYSLRLKRELAGDRLWVTAYANDQPAYIPSARMLGEGGYEVDQSMPKYGVVSRLAPEAEQRIIDTVRELVPPPYRKPAPSTERAR